MRGCPRRPKPYGGWEEPNCELRGHFVGHYLSACALMYASTGDEQLKPERGEATISWRSGGAARRSFHQRLPERLPGGVL
jgi:hypothetical protein